MRIDFDGNTLVAAVYEILYGIVLALFPIWLIKLLVQAIL